MATKTFNVGEVAVGGTVKVSVNNKISMLFIDNDGNILKSRELDTVSTKRRVFLFLQQHSNYYWANCIIEWINSKVPSTKEFEMNCDYWVL